MATRCATAGEMKPPGAGVVGSAAFGDEERVAIAFEDHFSAGNLRGVGGVRDFDRLGDR